MDNEIQNLASDKLADSNLKEIGFILKKADGSYMESYKILFQNLKMNSTNLPQFAWKFATRDQAVMRQRKFLKDFSCTVTIHYWNGKQVIE